MTENSFYKDEREEQAGHRHVDLTECRLEEELVGDVDHHVHEHSECRQDARRTRGDVNRGYRAGVVADCCTDY